MRSPVMLTVAVPIQEGRTPAVAVRTHTVAKQRADVRIPRVAGTRVRLAGTGRNREVTAAVNDRAGDRQGTDRSAFSSNDRGSQTKDSSSRGNQSMSSSRAGGGGSSVSRGGGVAAVAVAVGRWRQPWWRRWRTRRRTRQITARGKPHNHL